MRPFASASTASFTLLTDFLTPSTFIAAQRIKWIDGQDVTYSNWVEDFQPEGASLGFCAYVDMWDKKWDMFDCGNEEYFSCISPGNSLSCYSLIVYLMVDCF